MRMYNTNNLIQVEGGEKIKQADKGSWLSFALTDTNRNLVEGINGKTAKVVLYDKDRNKGWSYSTSVSDNKVRFKLPGNLEIGVYDLDITVNNMVFPSDRNTKIEIVEGATSFSGAGVSETLLELAGYAKTSDLDKKVDKINGKGLSTNDYTSADKKKVSAIPTSPKYTDTTYKAGNGLSLSGTTFSVDSTIARKSDIPSGVDLSEYAKKSDIPDIDDLGNIDLSGYAKKTELNSYLKKSELEPPFTVQRLDNLNQKLFGKDVMPDTLDSWIKLPSGYYKVTPGTLENQPSSHGIMRVINDNGERTIIYEQMSAGAIYRKSGNSRQISDWVRIDNPDYKAGAGLKLSGNTFSIDNTIARKSDIPSSVDLSGYAKTSDLDKKVDKVNGKGLSTNDYTSADKKKVSAIPTSPKYTDTTYKAGSGLSLSGTTFSVDSSIAKKSDLKPLPSENRTIRDINYYEVDNEPVEGVDWVRSSDGKGIGILKKYNKQRPVESEIDIKYSFAVPLINAYDMHNNLYRRPVLYTWQDLDIWRYTGVASIDWGKPYDTETKKFSEIRNSYYLSKEGYLAKIKDYSQFKSPDEKDYRPDSRSDYIKIPIEIHIAGQW